MFSLVLPTYNEAGNIIYCIESVCKVLRGLEFEIIVADDDSPDLTWKVAEDLKNPNVRVLRRTEDRGLSPAVVDAFKIAKGEFLGVMDADMQHDESKLLTMLNLLEQYEMVIASRAVEGGAYGDFSIPRKLTSWAAAAAAKLLLDCSLSDPMAGFFVLRKTVFERALPYLSPKGFKIMLEIFCCAAPLSYAEVGFIFRNRLAGESKLTAKVAFQFLGTLLELRKVAHRKISGD